MYKLLPLLNVNEELFTPNDALTTATELTINEPVIDWLPLNWFEAVVANEPVFPFTLALNVLIELLNVLKLEVKLLNEDVVTADAVNLFKDALVLFKDEVAVLTELLNVLTLPVKVLNEAVTPYIELVALLTELLNELNDAVVTNELVSTFNTDEVVANPKLVICTEELTTPLNEDVYVSNVDLDKNIDISVTKLPVSASVINEPVCPPKLLHLLSFDEVYDSNAEELKNGVTTANEFVNANP